MIFGKLIGVQIGDMDGFRYIDFIVPALILMSVIANSYANVVSSFYSSKFQHNIEELLIAPLPNFIAFGAATPPAPVGVLFPTLFGATCEAHTDAAFGLLGIGLAWEEGIELNVLGLAAGLDRCRAVRAVEAEDVALVRDLELLAQLDQIARKVEIKRAAHVGHAEGHAEFAGILTRGGDSVVDRDHLRHVLVQGRRGADAHLLGNGEQGVAVHR